jgi:hypothetical protein
VRAHWTGTAFETLRGSADATNDRGIFAVVLPVARFEGGAILNSSVDWA